MPLYSLAEIADNLEVPASTVRYHAKYYPEFLPTQEVEGERWPKYEEQALEVMRTILDGVADNLSREEIKDKLYELNFSVVNTPTGYQIDRKHEEPPEAPSLQLFEYMEELHHLYPHMMDTIKYLRELVETKDVLLKKQDEELRMLRETVEQYHQWLVEEQQAHHRTKMLLRHGGSVQKFLGRFRGIGRG